MQERLWRRGWSGRPLIGRSQVETLNPTLPGSSAVISVWKCGSANRTWDWKALWALIKGEKCSIHPSIRPFPRTYPGAGHGSSSLSKDAQTFFSPATFSRKTRGISKRHFLLKNIYFQIKQVIHLLFVPAQPRKGGGGQSLFDQKHQNKGTYITLNKLYNLAKWEKQYLAKSLSSEFYILNIKKKKYPLNWRCKLYYILYSTFLKSHIHTGTNI